MKILLIIVLICISLEGYSNTNPENEKTKKEKVNNKEDNISLNKNFHSIRTWKMTIEYTNGNIISKTIMSSENSSKSAMEVAFEEAEKYIRSLKNIKNYEVSPVSNNSYVLLVGNKK